MKNILTIVACMSLNFGASLFAQSLYNGGAEIYIQDGAEVFVDGEIVLDSANNGMGFISNQGLISLRGDWTNNIGVSGIMGSAGHVIFTGSMQLIGGIAPTEFFELSFSDSNMIVLQNNAIVNQHLNLGNTTLDLMTDTLWVKNPSAQSLRFDSGSIVSEASNEQGVVRWSIGDSSGQYVIPFATNMGSKIPLTFSVTTAGSGMGSIIFSTYPSIGANNLPLPNMVSNLDIDSDGIDDSLRLVDRFWRIAAEGFTNAPQSNIMFTYDANDIGGNNVLNTDSLNAIIWDSNTSSWSRRLGPSDSQTASVVAEQVSAYGVWGLASQDLFTSILNVDFLSSAKVYPNPSSGRIFLELNTKFRGQTNLQLCTLQGTTIQEEKQYLEPGFNKLQIDVQDLSPGPYIIKLQDQISTIYTSTILVLP